MANEEKVTDVDKPLQAFSRPGTATRVSSSHTSVLVQENNFELKIHAGVFCAAPTIIAHMKPRPWSFSSSSPLAILSTYHSYLFASMIERGLSFERGVYPCSVGRSCMVTCRVVEVVDEDE